ncbi:MAG: hypothetical protein DYG94_06455 [Leptolyngbya sp. PLA3]|nr:MAG: hypothetical protein EDM82_05735 [Cyanobacteria bacterium CYA]MCE7968371.1 hypothetical protein [Leptolyngbya sp. PL-A3]
MSNPRKTTTTKQTTGKTSAKKVPAKKTPRMSASAARAEGAAKTKRALADAKAASDKNLKAIAAADQENAKKRDERAASADGMTASERAMSVSKPKKAPATKPAAKREPKPKRVSGLDLAAKVLADARRPLPVKDITELVLAAGWITNGKTPESTLYAAIIREIARKGKDARFAKHARGLFTATFAKEA